jgi:hypothetical protein
MCQRALTIIPDGYTVFLREYFGNFEGKWVQPVSAVLIPILGMFGF